MNGLDLAEAYYREIGAPMIEARFGSIAGRIATGLVGPGSECFGFDDELSRDHDWGPAFSLWLTDEDFPSVGGELQFAYAQLPPVFMGQGPRPASAGEEWRVGTSSITGFYGRFTGLPRVPKTNAEWLRIPEHSLATCTNGRVFRDDLGEFGSWRAGLLAYYPEDVRLTRIAPLCITIAQNGQYNYGRAVVRGQDFAATQSLVRFCADSMQLAFLLNRRYAPFSKWLHRSVRELPAIGETIHDGVQGLLDTSRVSARPAVIEAMVASLADEMRRQGISDSNGDFLLEHAGHVRDLIRDPALRERALLVQ